LDGLTLVLIFRSETTRVETRTELARLRRAAEAWLQAHPEAQGLTVSVVRKPNDEMAKGLVVRQDPGAGTKLNKGENVELTVSDTGVPTSSCASATPHMFKNAFVPE
jgi:hypothetical protein